MVNDRKRLFSIDVLRVISSFLVIVQHSISSEWTRLGAELPASAEWRIMNFVFMIARMSVPVFFMASGAVMLCREQKIKRIWTHNIAGITVTYIAWMLIYGIREAAVIIANGNATPRVICNAFIKQILFGSYHTWFLMALLGLYTLTPLLSVVVSNDGHLAYFCLISFTATCIFPLIIKIDTSHRIADTINDLSPGYVSGYVLYYILGYFLIKKAMDGRHRFSAMIVALLSIIMAYHLSNYLSVRDIRAVQEPYTDLSFLGVLIAGSLFYLSIGISEPGKETLRYRCVRHLSNMGLGVYLLHPLYLHAITRWFSGWKTLIAACIVWGLSVMICSVLYFNKTIRRIFLRI